MRFLFEICLCRKVEDGNGESSTTNEKRVWEEDDDQADLNNKRTRADLAAEAGSGK